MTLRRKCDLFVHRPISRQEKTLNEQTSQHQPIKRDPLLNLMSSERMERDAKNVMNSSFWLEQIKMSNAFGLTDAVLGT
jgi:hypothetical protein